MSSQIDIKIEARIKSLEASFSTLSNQLDQLKLALEYIQKDPQSSLTKSRVVLESIINRIYEIEMQKEPKKFEIGYILSDNQFTRKIEYRIISRMNSIRDMANMGPHEKGEVNPADAIRVLDDLCEVIEWYMKRYEHKELITTAEDFNETGNAKLSLVEEKALPSIAVLPFVNISPDNENEYFSNGLAEEIINALSNLEGLHVTARTSAFRFRGKDLDIRDIGKQLNVSTILEGSVRKWDNQLRITAQLINVADGYHLWSERYDRKLEDVFAIQDEITLAIVDKLKVKLLGDEKEKLSKQSTDDFEVFDLYLKGRHYLYTLSEEGIKKSLNYFQQAIQKDPSYALAYVGEASVYNVLAVTGQLPSNETMPKARLQLLKAIELDDSLAEAHAYLGELYLQYEWNWPAAKEEFKRAIELKPNNPESHQFYADYLTVTGDFDQALTEVEHAQILDPLSTIPHTILAYQFFASHRFDDAIERCRKILKTEPSFLLQVHLWRSLHKNNLFEEAFKECKKLFTLFIDREIALVMEHGYIEHGYKYAMLSGARKLVEKSAERYFSPTLIATLFAHAEDDEMTLLWLEKGCEERDQISYSMGVDPDWARVRSNPRFLALLRKIGFKKD